MLRSNTSCFTTRRAVPTSLGSSIPVFLRPFVPLRSRPGLPLSPLLSSPIVVPSSSSSLRERLQLSSSPFTTEIVALSPVAPRLVCSSAKISSSSSGSSSSSSPSTPQQECNSSVSVFAIITLFRYLLVEACFPSSSPSSLLSPTNRAEVMKDFLKDDHRHRSRVVKKIRKVLTQQLLPHHGEASIDDFAFAASETLKQVSLSNEKMETNVMYCCIDGFMIPPEVSKKLAAETAAKDPHTDEPVDLYRKQLAKELVPHLRVVWDFCRKEHKKMFPWGYFNNILLS